MEPDPYEKMEAFNFIGQVVAQRVHDYGYDPAQPLTCRDAEVMNLGIQLKFLGQAMKEGDPVALDDFDAALEAIQSFCEVKEPDLSEDHEGRCFLKACEELQEMKPQLIQQLAKFLETMIRQSNVEKEEPVVKSPPWWKRLFKYIYRKESN